MRKRNRPLATMWLLAVSAAIHAESTQSIFDFRVPGGPLEKVLASVTAQAGATFQFDGPLAPGLEAAGIFGRHTLAEAVEQALAGSGWHVVSASNGQIHLARDTEEAASAEAIPEAMPTLVVTAYLDSFKENYSSVASNTNTPLKDVPATVDAVTQEVLSSRNTFSLEDALRNIPGAIYVPGSPSQVQVGGTSTGAGNNDGTASTFTNGLRNGGLDDNTPVFAMQSIEFLQGASSILSGTQAGGGLLNYVPKTANGINPTDIQLGFGSNGQKTLGIDAGNAVPHFDQLYYRVVGFAQQADEGPTGGNDPSQYMLSPMLGYREDHTTADLQIQLVRTRLVPGRADYLDGDGNIQPYDKLYNPDQNITTKYGRVAYNLDQDLVAQDDWTLKLRAKGMFQSGRQTGQHAPPVFALGAKFLVEPTGFYDSEHTTSQHVDLYSLFHTGPIEQQLLVGFDYYRRVFLNRFAINVGTYTVDQTPPLTEVPTSDLIAQQADASTVSRGVSSQHGLTIQDQMNWGRIHTLFALRKSWYGYRVDAVEYEFGTLIPTNPNPVDVTKVTPSAGVVVDLTRQISAYVSYTEAFSPAGPNETTVNGTPLPPSDTKRYEVGLKTSFVDDRLSFNSAVFRYTTNNSAQVDPQFPQYYLPGPGEEAKGVELAATGSLARTVSVVAGYTYTDVASTSGLPYTTVARHIANLWLLESIKSGPFKGLDIGFGGNYNSGDWMTDINKELAGETNFYTYFPHSAYSLDGALGYTIGHVKLNLTVDNLLGRRNYVLPSTTSQLQIGKPRIFQLVADVRL